MNLEGLLSLEGTQPEKGMQEEKGKNMGSEDRIGGDSGDNVSPPSTPDKQDAGDNPTREILRRPRPPAIPPFPDEGTGDGN